MATSAPSSAVLKQVCIVGGGNAAHALAALLPSRGISTVWYAPFKDEAQRIQTGLDKQGHIAAQFAAHNTPNGLVKGCPTKVSGQAKDVIPESNVLLLPLPSFAYPSILADIKDHLKPGTFIGVTPGQGGFDWTAREVLGPELCASITFFSIMPMPFNCRITEFGHSVDVQTFKQHYRIGVIPESNTEQALEINKILFGDTVSVGHFLTCTLYPINAIIHPQRLYRLCKDWTPGGPPLPENPLFYESMDKESVDLMDAVNKELIQIGQALKEKGGMNVDVPHIYDFLSWVYSDVKVNNMVELFGKNDAYKGFRCPFVEQEGGGWIPNFQNRYFTEDIPLGLCIYKGVADIVDVPTPTMDKVLAWAQEHMGKEYIVDGKLVGKDVKETTAPQRFGLTTMEDLNRGYAS